MKKIEAGVSLVIECPWCHHEVEIVNKRSPKCRQRLYEVLDTDFDDAVDELMDGGQQDTVEQELPISVEDHIMSSFRCMKCKCMECSIKEVAMTGVGFSKLLDIQHNHFLFVSCMNCGYVEVYDPNILRQTKSGKLGTVMDILFGG
ncbi:zinc ribbon domain-containing protein [Paenibacillus harenae]|uniref:zinc ribbon domain-containing protein n=1 Tax=Paenibacillus harenae TaxID=306543 RepID=UPI002793B63A|nr:zinc ribbon domain-containing protein [Paenibacillus harenae]MDQ0060093.1 putative nucleic-acid-binding Zn-ribbon protein [Paenibacillus harenae]